MPASVHQRAVGRCGLGSAATQLMRAVSWHETTGVSSPNGRRAAFEVPSRSEWVVRQVVVSVRAGGSLEDHAAVGLALAASYCANVRRTEARSHSPRPSRSVFAAESVGVGRRLFGSTCLGPLIAVVAPLAAGERVSVGAAAAFSAWPPALRERWHTWRRCWLAALACRQLTITCS
jgi:hypothetical protein